MIVEQYLWQELWTRIVLVRSFSLMLMIIFKLSGQDGWGYCVFGKVTEGMDIVNKIKEVNTKNMGPHQNVPVDPIIIQSIELVEQG